MKTIQDIYYVQQQARRILKCLYKPDYSKLNVHASYLNRINKAQFWEAFGDLRGIFENYYTEAVKNPSNLSLPVYEIDKYRNMSSEAREGNTALLDFPKTLFAAGLCAKLNKNALIINISVFKQEFKNIGGKKLKEQINRLSDYGFKFSQWNGKSFPSKCETFEIEYPDNKNMLAVLLAVGERLKKYSQIEPENSTGLYKLERFVFLDPNLYANDAAELPLKTLEQMADAVGKPLNDLLFKIAEKFKEYGMELRFETAFQKNRFFNEKSKDTLNHIFYGDYREGREGNECLFLRLKLNHPSQYIEKINSLPQNLKESFENVWCNNCFEKCKLRIVYELDGKEKRACGCFSFNFKNPEIKNLDALMEIYDAEQEARILQKKLKRKKNKEE